MLDEQAFDTENRSMKLARGHGYDLSSFVLNGGMLFVLSLRSACAMTGAVEQCDGGSATGGVACDAPRGHRVHAITRATNAHPQGLQV